MTLAGALLAIYGDRRFRRGRDLDWQVAGWPAVLGGLIAVGLQIWQLTRAALLPRLERLRLVLHRLGRHEHRRAPGRRLLARDAPGPVAPAAPGRRREDGGASRSTLPAARLFRANLEGCTYFWGFIALVAVSSGYCST